MSEWHVEPVYISEHWTQELFDLMVTKLVERRAREKEAIENPEENKKISDTELFARMGLRIQHKEKD